MDTVELQVEARAGHGTGPARALRRDGRIPAVVYAGGRPAESVSLSVEAFVAAMNGPMGRNTRFLLAGAEGLAGQLALVKDIQKTPVSRDVLHVDLLAVEPTQKVVVRVPVRLTGHAAGVEEGGIVRQLRRDVDVRCGAGLIPEYVELSVDGLQLGESLSVSDLEFSEGLEAVYRHDFAIVRMLIPRGLEEAVEETDEDGEEGEGGAETEATEGADGDAGEGGE